MSPPGELRLPACPRLGESSGSAHGVSLVCPQVPAEAAIQSPVLGTTIQLFLAAGKLHGLCSNPPQRRTPRRNYRHRITLSLRLRALLPARRASAGSGHWAHAPGRYRDAAVTPAPVLLPSAARQGLPQRVVAADERHVPTCSGPSCMASPWLAARRTSALRAILSQGRE